jgi:hypothetical protein
MQMIGQEHDGKDVKRQPCANLSNCVTQPSPMIGILKQRSTTLRHNRKEIHPSGDMPTSVIAHARLP